MRTPHLAKCCLVSLASTVTLSLAILSSGLIEVQAQPNKTAPVKHSQTLKPRERIIERKETPRPEQPAEQSLSYALPPPPDNVWAPGQRSAEGSSRGRCETVKNLNVTNGTKSLTALVPVYKSKDAEVVWGRTTAAHPTFWFYSPYFSAIPGEFVLQNEADKTIYKSSISLPGEPGVVSVSLPSSTPSLKVGNRYHWYFNVYCESQQPPAFVHGWIQRENLSSALKSKLEAMTPKQRVAFFAAQGLWYNALASSAELHHVNPNDTTWATLLSAIGLNAITSEQIKNLAQNPIPKL